MSKQATDGWSSLRRHSSRSDQKPYDLDAGPGVKHAPDAPGASPVTLRSYRASHPPRESPGHGLRVPGTAPGALLADSRSTLLYEKEKSSAPYELHAAYAVAQMQATDVQSAERAQSSRKRDRAWPVEALIAVDSQPIRNRRGT